MIKCDFQIAIAGGGIAGLSAAILLSRAGYKTVLIEKNKYPFHKVCGEYISLEALDFLKSINFEPEEYKLPFINKFKLTAGKSTLTTKLPLGGFGVSRYFLDEKLMLKARETDTLILEKTQARDITFTGEYFKVKTTSKDFTANVVLGAFGKQSNLSKEINRKNKSGNNYIGVKYHVLADIPQDQIELHLFQDGYCGISKVEGANRYCMCYMTTANNLNNSGNNIAQLERVVLSKNPNLKKYFNQFEKLPDFPVTIAQIHLGVKEIIHNNIIMIGDAAGTIAPLCGNGMSMAFHSAYIASDLIDQYLYETINYKEVLEKYKLYWKRNFFRRIYSGNYFQKLFLNVNAASMAINILKHTPSLHAPLIRLTHGKNFIEKSYEGIPVR